MAEPTPNNPNPPKKPAVPTPQAGQPAPKPAVPGQPRPAQPGQPQAAKPAVPGQPRPATPGVPKPTVPGQPAKPGQAAAARPATPGARPAAKPAAKPPEKKKAAPMDGTRKLAQTFVDLGFIDDAQMEQLLEDVRTKDQTIERVAIDSGLVSEDQLLQAVAEQHGLKVIDLDSIKPDPAAIKLVQKNMAELYKMVPLSMDHDTLTVAFSSPDNLQAIDDIRNFLGIANVVAAIAPAKKIEEAQARAYSNTKEESLAQIIASLEEDDELANMKGTRGERSIDLESLEELANAAPVRKLINMVLLMGIRDHASDIHFEPFEDEYKMRYRCDGVLYEMVPPPRHLANAIASRIKVMSNLDIAERRLPQDGRIELNIGGSAIDMRVSVLPTMFGESVVIRVLDRSNTSLDLGKIGMPPGILHDFRSLINKPNGITLVTGPTGAGKTTTLYSALSELNQITDKIITTEDPVEYEVDGLIQCQVNSEIDLTFASALRAILRQDPDRILVGEIRDLETAQIAIQASLTGHMVFSTLHTNDAPSTITRLRDMGVEPYLITATVEGILAQRLVRRICPACKVALDPSKEQLMELNLAPELAVGKKIYFGEGCDRCNNLGFKGRTGLYELLIMTDELRDMVSKGASTDQLRKNSRERKVKSLRDAGLEALFNGLTNLDEVVRETVIEDEG
jgi:type IV pilus assembly protein PilB